MAVAATTTTSLIAFTLPSTPYSVQMARFYVRAALTYHELGDYSEDAVMVTSELVTNAIEHTGALKFGLEVIHMIDSRAVAVIVTDASPHPPIKHDLFEGTEHGEVPRASRTVHPIGWTIWKGEISCPDRRRASHRNSRTKP